MTGTEVDLDLDLFAHHVPGERYAVMRDARAALGHDDSAIGHPRLGHIHVDAGGARGGHQASPVGIAAVPAALHQIVLDDVLRGDPGFIVVRGAGDDQPCDPRHAFGVASHLHGQVLAGRE